MALRFKVDLAELSKKLGIVQETLHRGLVEGVAEGLFAMARLSFQEQRSPEGAPWAALSPRYSMVKARLFPGRPILQARGALLRSLFRGAQGNVAMVGSNLPYAAIHQFGGLAGRGRKARIPARPYLPSPETAEQEALRVGEDIVEEAIRKSEAA